MLATLATLATLLNTIATYLAAYQGTGIRPLGMTVHRVRHVTHHCDACGDQVTEFCPAHPGAPVLSILA